LIYPILEGIYERREEDKDEYPRHSHRHTETLIKSVKDHRRTIDYLETREDIDMSKIGFHGFSWGACMGGIVPAVEDRIKAQVLVLGGMHPADTPDDFPYPEAAQITYIPRVKIPTMMLNGRYDLTLDYTTQVKPFFDLLETPEGDKENKLSDSDHFIPRNDVIRESIQWFNKYLGPVERKIP
jgi:dienelactone hydrolase